VPCKSVPEWVKPDCRVSVEDGPFAGVCGVVEAVFRDIARVVANGKVFTFSASQLSPA